jgi:hypothetical protein
MVSLGQLLKLALGLGNYLVHHVLLPWGEELQGKEEIPSYLCDYSQSGTP